jgi:hypothetical protein
MTFWNDILHTALLGTDKTDISPAGLGPDLAPLAEHIRSQASDKEERFLRPLPWRSTIARQAQQPCQNPTPDRSLRRRKKNPIAHRLPCRR